MKILLKTKDLKIGSLFSLLAVLFFSAGCNKNMGSNIDSGVLTPPPIMQGTSSGNPGGNPSSGLVSFKVVYDNVLKDNCISCHNRNDAAKGIRYDTYEATIQSGQLSRLHTDYLRYREPSSECKSISNAKMDLVVQWIEDGAIQ